MYKYVLMHALHQKPFSRFSKRISERNMEQKNERKRKAAWTREETDQLQNYVLTHGAGQWETVSRALNIGKSPNSCRLKWFNYLNPNIVRGEFTDEEILEILKLRIKGNGWSKIAKELHGRSDNDIKNFWNSARMKKEAGQLNCDVSSQEFLQKMTSILTERIQLGVGSDTTGGSSLKADMSVSTSSSDVVDCTYNNQELIMSSDIHGSYNGDQDCGICGASYGESVRVFVDAFLDGRIILPADQHCFDTHNYYVGQEF